MAEASIDLIFKSQDALRKLRREIEASLKNIGIDIEPAELTKRVLKRGGGNTAAITDQATKKVDEALEAVANSAFKLAQKQENLANNTNPRRAGGLQTALNQQLTAAQNAKIAFESVANNANVAADGLKRLVAFTQFNQVITKLKTNTDDFIQKLNKLKEVSGRAKDATLVPNAEVLFGKLKDLASNARNRQVNVPATDRFSSSTRANEGVRKNQLDDLVAAIKAANPKPQLRGGLGPATPSGRSDAQKFLNSSGRGSNTDKELAAEKQILQGKIKLGTLTDEEGKLLSAIATVQRERLAEERRLITNSKAQSKNDRSLAKERREQTPVGQAQAAQKEADAQLKKDNKEIASARREAAADLKRIAARKAEAEALEVADIKEARREAAKARADILAEQKKQASLQRQITAAETKAFNSGFNRASGGGGRGGGGGGGGRPPSGGPPDDPFKKSVGSVKDLTNALHDGDKAAFKFGQSVAAAAERLAAWATPSIFIFKTISLLNQAVDEIIALDAQTRRLIFFESNSEGGLAGFNAAMENGVAKTKLLTEANKNLIKEATRTGLTLAQVAEGANTVARIGEFAFLKDGTSSDFLQATLGLVQIEKGAISADRAAEVLQATMKQFGIETTQVTAIAAKFATVANETSSNIEQLATLVTRFGSAALNVQNLTFDESLALASITAKTLGTNTFRAATALRQLNLRIAERADEVKKITGIDIKIADSGQLAGGKSLLDVLERIGELQSTVAGVELGALLGDRENLADIFAISRVVPEIRKAFEELNDPAQSAAKTLEQIAAFENIVALSADDLQSRINNLNTSFTSLASTAGAGTFVKNTVSGFTTLVQFTDKLVAGLDSSGKAFAALQAVGLLALTRLATKGISAFKGAFSKSLIDATGGAGAEIADPKTFEKGVGNAVGKGFISDKEGLKALQGQAEISNNIALFEGRIAQLKARRNILEKQGASKAKEILLIDQGLLVVNKEINRELARGEALRSGVVSKVGRGAAIKQVIGSVGLALPGLAVAANAVAGDSIARFIANGLDKNKNEVRTAVGNALNAAALGGTIGAAFGPIGAAIGTVIGLAVGTAFNKQIQGLKRDFGPLFEDLAGEEEKQKKALERLKRTAKNFSLIDKPQSVSLDVQQRAAAREREVKAAARQGETQKQIAIITADIAEFEETIAAKRQLNQSTSLEEEEVLKRQVQKEQLLFRLSSQESDEKERQLRLEKEIATVRRQDTAFGGLNDQIRDVQVQLAQLTGSKFEPILIEAAFNRNKIFGELKSITDEIGLKEKRTRELTEGSDSNRDERIRLEREVGELRDKETEKRIKLFEIERNLIQQRFEIAKEESKTIIAAYAQVGDTLRDAASAVLGQFGSVFSSRRAVGEDRRAIAGNAIENGRRNGLTGRNIQGAGQVGVAAQAVAQRQAVLAQIKQGEVLGQLGRRFKEVSDEDLAKLSSATKELADIQEQLSGELPEFARQEREIRQIALNDQVKQIRAQIDAQRQGIDLSRNRLEELAEATRDVISEQVNYIQTLEDAAKRQAALGEEAVTNPEQFLKDLQAGLRAQQFFGDINKFDRGEVRRFDQDGDRKLNEAESRVAVAAEISRRVLAAQNNGQGAFLAQILEGTKALEKLGVAVGGVAAEDLREILGRAIITPGEQLGEQINKELKAAQDLTNSSTALTQILTKLGTVSNERLALESKILVAEEGRAKILQIEFERIRDVRLPQAFELLVDRTQQLKNSLGEMNGVLVTQQEGFVRSLNSLQVSVERSEQLFKNLGTAIANFVAGLGTPDQRPSANPRKSAEKVSISDKLSDTNALRPMFEDFLARLAGTTLRLDTTIPPIELQINANIKTVLEGEDFIETLREKLAGTDLQDRVEEIRQVLLELVRVERSRGTELPLIE
jgi:hypothetical protein